MHSRVIYSCVDAIIRLNVAVCFYMTSVLVLGVYACPMLWKSVLYLSYFELNKCNGSNLIKRYVSLGEVGNPFEG